jgi:hypothetical protein
MGEKLLDNEGDGDYPSRQVAATGSQLNLMACYKAEAEECAKKRD